MNWLRPLVTFAVIAYSLAGKANVSQLQNDLVTTKNHLLKSDEEQTKATQSLTKINSRLKKLVQKRGKTERERVGLEANVKDLAQKILDLQNKNKAIGSILRQRVRGLTQFSAPSFLQLLLTSKNAADLERNLKVLGKIAKKDLDLLKEYRSREIELTQKQKVFLARLSHLKKLEKNLTDQTVSINKELDFKLSIINRERERKKRVLSRLAKLKSKMLEQAPAGEQNAFFEMLLQANFFEKKGQLPSPIDVAQSEVIAPFGLIRDSDFDVIMSNKGVRLGIRPRANESQSIPVRSVFNGKISYNDYIPGVGNTIIIDHGDYYYSVYSGELESNLKIQDRVQEGDKIALVKNELYFEIRHFSEPYDPTQWLKGWSQ